MNSITLILLSCVLTAAGQIAFKFGMQAFANADFSGASLPRVLWQMLLNPTIIFGFFAFGAGAILWLFALARTELTYAATFASVTYVLVLLAGVFVFRESFTAIKIAGATLVAAGIVLISLK
jgi:drug/metabolite transporter (DMT)-like permease